MTKKDFEKGSYEGLVWLFVIIIGLWILWYYSGGPQRADTQTGPFMQPPAPLGNGQGYDSVGH